MAGFDYGRMQATASRLMARFRQGAVLLTRTVTAAPNPATPWIPGTSTSTSYSLDATVSAAGDKANAQYVDGTTIVATDLEVTCAVPSIVPQMSDTVSIDGKVRAIKKIVQLPSAGVPVAFKLFVAG